MAAARVLPQPQATFEGERQALVDAVRAALYASKICAYAQGMALLKAALSMYQYNFNLGAVAKIWWAGCIIRARFLDDVSAAFERTPDLANLLLDPFFSTAIAERDTRWREALCSATELGIATPALSSALGYYDAYRAAARQPDSSAARLLRRAHVSAHRQRRNVS
jgi:6-phosphogluconate dehydrogenase